MGRRVVIVLVSIDSKLQNFIVSPCLFVDLILLSLCPWSSYIILFVCSLAISTIVQRLASSGVKSYLLVFNVNDLLVNSQLVYSFALFIFSI